MRISLLVLLLVAAAVCAVRLIARRKGIGPGLAFNDRESDAVHLLMTASMAAMLTPLYTADLRHLILMSYWVAATLLVARISWTAWPRRKPGQNKPGPDKPGPDRRQIIGGSIYHLLALLAMVYASHLMPATGEDMDMSIMMNGPDWTSKILGGVFLLDGLVLAVMTIRFPRLLLGATPGGIQARTPSSGPPGNWDRASIRDLRISAFPHIAMDIGMVAMLALPMALMGSP